MLLLPYICTHAHLHAQRESEKAKKGTRAGKRERGEHGVKEESVPPCRPCCWCNTDRQIDRQTDTHTRRQTDRHTDRQTDRHTHTHTHTCIQRGGERDREGGRGRER
jgi:hypothetical protein